MAKSSRSKWKKLHRRQKAKEEATNTVKRIKQLHKKLELTIKGGISAVPPQEPERRFHFLNPELDPRVPNTRKDLNNNYRAELNHVQYDYTKPLKLAAPKSNFYGKSDTEAPHPMTQNFETLDADAPIGGHALTKADVERMAQKELAKAAAAAAGANEEEVNDAEVSDDDEAADSDGPEEFVFGMNDAAPRRAKKKKASSSKKAAAAAEEDEDEDEEEMPRRGSSSSSSHLHSSGNGATNRITSMQAVNKKNGIMVSASGASKMKKVGSQGGASGTRVVSSGGKAAQKKSGSKKVGSK